MYMNNRAAEAFVQGQLDDAYWWARAAVGAGPAVPERLQHARDHLPAARRSGGGGEGFCLRPRARTREHPCHVEPRAPARRMGRAAEAKVLAAKLESWSPIPPSATSIWA